MPELPLTFTDYREMKAKIHQQILKEIDLENLNKLQETVARNRVADAIRELLHRDRTPLALAERDRMVHEIVDELFGLGPIEPLLADHLVSDILVNGPDKIYVERKGILEKTSLFFNDSAHLMRIIDRIVSRVGRRVDESSPMVDARLADGSRVNAIIPPLALDGPSVSIRRFGGHKISTQGYIDGGTLTKPMIDLLEACVKGKLNVMVSGGTGAGKTTLLNILSSFIPDTERIITIEDAAELKLKQHHVVRLETRPPNIEGKGGIRQRQLVINALRMRPDRIIVGEVRGEEAIDMLQAMNTGHEGSLTTIHANTPRDALSRLETMIAMAELNLPDRAVRSQIASAINLIVQVSRLPDGSRKITNICEISGMEGNVITTQDLFVYERQGYDEKNRVKGVFKPLGIRPKFTEKLESHGIKFDPDMFFREPATRGGR
jgi:pilus assembly protein CpaF